MRLPVTPGPSIAPKPTVKKTTTPWAAAASNFKAPKKPKKAKVTTTAKAPAKPKGTSGGAATPVAPYQPAGLSVGVSGQSQINSLKAQLEQQKALRKYQEDASRRDLQTNLGIIDRSALETYKDVSDDYAGRGMLRSGGYAKTDDKAYTAVVEEKNRLNKAMEDLTRTNEFQNLIDQEGLNANVASIKQAAAQQQISNYLQAIADAQNTFGAQPKAPKATAPKATTAKKKKKKKKAGTTPASKLRADIRKIL